MHEKNIIRKIEDLFSAMDLLESIGNVHPEERKIHYQRYQELRKKIIFKQNLQKYGLEMSKRTGQYLLCKD